MIGLIYYNLFFFFSFMGIQTYFVLESLKHMYSPSCLVGFDSEISSDECVWGIIPGVHQAVISESGDANEVNNNVDTDLPLAFHSIQSGDSQQSLSPVLLVEIISGNEADSTVNSYLPVVHDNGESSATLDTSVFSDTYNTDIPASPDISEISASFCVTPTIDTNTHYTHQDVAGWGPVLRNSDSSTDLSGEDSVEGHFYVSNYCWGQFQVDYKGVETTNDQRVVSDMGHASFPELSKFTPVVPCWPARGWKDVVWEGNLVLPKSRKTRKRQSLSDRLATLVLKAGIKEVIYTGSEKVQNMEVSTNDAGEERVNDHWESVDIDDEADFLVYCSENDILPFCRSTF